MDYWLAIDAMKALESLEDINVAAFPHLKATDRKKLVRDLKSRSTKPVKSSDDRVNSIGALYQQLARKLKRNG